MVAMLQEKIEKAKTLVEALPYIKKFHNETIVIKYGGSLMVEEDLKPVFAEDVVLLRYVGMKPIIVHGGGKEISKWMKKVGKDSVFIDGLRVTDEETMELTEMVLSGKISNEVVSLINHGGGKAIGLSGKDAKLFTAKKIRSKSDQDLGQVGDIDQTDVSLLHTLCDQGYIPVISSVAMSEAGESLNLNADYVASGIAGALNAMKLVYLTDVKGVTINDELQQSLNVSEVKNLLSHPDVSGGMIPKLDCSARAITSGVQNVHIINGTVEHSLLLEMFTDVGIGTMISNEKTRG